MDDRNESVPYEGKQPKSADDIRASLQAIHKSADADVETGPLSGGLSRDYPLAVATFYDRAIARSFQQLLSQSGIFSKFVSQPNGASVFVDNDDHDRAVALLRKHRGQFPNRIPKRESQRFDLLIFGCAIGLTMGGIVMSGVDKIQNAIAIPITFTIVGAAAGHLLDCIRMRHIRTGRYRLGIWELMIIVSLICMTIMAGRFVDAIFQT